MICFSLLAPGQVTCAAFSPDLSLLAVGDANREVKVWDRSSWATRVSGKWVFHTTTVSCLSWDPTGLFVASGSLDESIYVWNLEKPMKKRQIKCGFSLSHSICCNSPYLILRWAAVAHKAGVSAVNYVNEATLVTAGNDGCVATWNLA